MAKQDPKSIRLPVGVKAEVRFADGSSRKGELKNVSFGGVFVKLLRMPSMKAGDVCDVKILLQEGGAKMEIPLKCSVVHVQKDGICLIFVEIRLDHYEKFMTLMVMNSENPKVLLAELKRAPGLKIV